MNKLMLGAAAVALTLAVSPAFAADDSGVKLGLGGFFKGYANYADETSANRSFDLLRQTEVHVGGETTLDNGLTVGMHIEADADGGEDFSIDETYVYGAGAWGRVNVGEEDGAAYLLQVAVPGADDNIDGLRPVIETSVVGNGVNYANDYAKDGDKVTYLSPIFGGFQVGASWTPENTISAAAGPNHGGTADSDVLEAAARYEGMVGGVGLIAGAGYTTADDADVSEWNVGADLDIGAFGVGAAYTKGDTVTSGVDLDKLALGVDYTTGPFKLGASYLNAETSATVEVDKYTAGVVYSYGPGMTFRGSVGYAESDAAGDPDATTATVGTQINF